MKLPVRFYITFFSLLLFVSTTESRKELEDQRWKNVMEDEYSSAHLNQLFIGGEKPFINDIELQPNTDNALYMYKTEQSPRGEKLFFNNIELQPNTDNALYIYKTEQSPGGEKSFINDIELQPNTDNALYIYKTEPSPRGEKSFINDIELQPNTDNALYIYKPEQSPRDEKSFINDIELQPNIDNALYIYKTKQSSLTSFQKKPTFIKDIEPQPNTDNNALFIRMVTKHDSQEINATEYHMKDMLYFSINDLKLGKKILFYLPQNDLSTTPSLPKEIADSIPFSLKQLPQILNFFSFPLDSPEAQVVINALGLCERKPIEGETKFCATSMKSIVDFVHSVLGSGGKSTSVKHLATTLLTKSKSHPNLQNYTLLQMPHEIKVSEYFACHVMRYPYLVRYCHYRFGYTKVLQFPMEGENGDRIQALAVCHMDTSEWNSKHLSFHVLNTKPRTFPICHIFPLTDFIWLPISTST